MNQSDTERFVRIVIGGVLLLAATYVAMNIILVWVLIILGLILILTGLSGYCPCYKALRINTRK